MVEKRRWTGEETWVSRDDLAGGLQCLYHFWNPSLGTRENHNPKPPPGTKSQGQPAFLGQRTGKKKAMKDRSFDNTCSSPGKHCERSRGPPSPQALQRQVWSLLAIRTMYYARAALHFLPGMTDVELNQLHFALMWTKGLPLALLSP